MEHLFEQTSQNKVKKIDYKNVKKFLHEAQCLNSLSFWAETVFLLSVLSHAQVQIVHKKIDLTNVTSKCGSKDNIRHKPGKILLEHTVMKIQNTWKHQLSSCFNQLNFYNEK